MFCIHKCNTIMICQLKISKKNFKSLNTFQFRMQNYFYLLNETMIYVIQDWNIIIEYFYISSISKNFYLDRQQSKVETNTRRSVRRPKFESRIITNWLCIFRPISQNFGASISSFAKTGKSLSVLPTWHS